MAKIKYKVVEFTPTANQTNMTHSVYAEPVINDKVTSLDLAKKVAARIGDAEENVLRVIYAISSVAMEQLLESNSVSLSMIDGSEFVRIYPSLDGRITDKDAQAAGQTVATKAMLTANMITVKGGATVGSKFSKLANDGKSLEKVGEASISGGTSDPTNPDNGGDNNGGGGNGGNSNEE